MIYGLPIQGLGAVVSKKSPRPAKGAIGPSPPAKVVAETVKTEEGRAVLWNIGGIPMARLGDVAPRSRPQGDPDSLVPAVPVLGYMGTGHRILVLSSWPGMPAVPAVQMMETWVRGKKTPGGMHCQAIIHRNRLASLAGPWKGASVTPVGDDQPSAAERDLWSRPYSALPSGLVWRRDEEQPPVRAAMGSSPSKGEQTVWDASPAAPDRPRGTPWEHEEVRPYAPEPPPAPLASATAAHRGPGRVVLRLAKADRPLIESVAVGMKDGRRINLVVVRPSTAGRSVTGPGVRLVVLKDGTSRLDLRMERGVPFILVVDGTGGKVPLTLVGLAHIRTMGQNPWIISPEAVSLRDRDRARKVVVAGLEALAKARAAGAGHQAEARSEALRRYHADRYAKAKAESDAKVKAGRKYTEGKRAEAAAAARSYSNLHAAVGLLARQVSEERKRREAAGRCPRGQILSPSWPAAIAGTRPEGDAAYSPAILLVSLSRRAVKEHRRRPQDGVVAPAPDAHWRQYEALKAAFESGRVEFRCHEDVG